MSHRVSGSGVWDGSSWVVLAQGLSWLQSSEALTGAVDRSASTLHMVGKTVLAVGKVSAWGLLQEAGGVSS